VAIPAIGNHHMVCLQLQIRIVRASDVHRTFGRPLGKLKGYPVNDKRPLLRSFVAIQLSDQQLLTALSEKLGQLRRRLKKPALRWLNPENYHLTLHFLGDVSEANLYALTERLTLYMRGLPAFDIQFTGITPFPRHRASMVALRAVASPPLKRLRLITTNAARELGLREPDHGDFAPHVTLARMAGKTRSKLRFHAVELPRKTPVDCLHIVISELTPGGAKYRLFTTVALATR